VAQVVWGSLLPIPVRSDPMGGNAANDRDVSLNDLVGGGQQRFWDGKPEPLRGFEIDDQINFGDLLHGEVGGLVAFENVPGIDASLAVHIAEAAAIAH
jgi:hypothetical protein